MGDLLEFRPKDKNNNKDMNLLIKTINTPQKDIRPDKAGCEEEQRVLEDNYFILEEEIPKAIVNLEAYAGKNKVSSVVYARIAELYFELENEKKANLNYDTAIEMDKGNAEYYIDYSDYYIKKYIYMQSEGKMVLNEAVAAFNKAVAIMERAKKHCPTNPRVHLEYVNVVLKNNDSSKIDYFIKELENARSLAYKKYEPIKKTQAEIHEVMGRADYENPAYKEAKKLVIDIEEKLISLYEHKGEFKKVVKLILSLHDHGKEHSGTYFSLGYAYEQLNFDDMAVQWYNMALKKAAHYIEPAMGKARILNKMGKYKEARECLEGMLEYYPPFRQEHEEVKEALEQLNKK